MLKKFIEGWAEAFRYYKESDKGRRKITAKYTVDGEEETKEFTTADNTGSGTTASVYSRAWTKRQNRRRNLDIWGSWE